MRNDTTYGETRSSPTRIVGNPSASTGFCRLARASSTSKPKPNARIVASVTVSANIFKAAVSPTLKHKAIADEGAVRVSQRHPTITVWDIEQLHQRRAQFFAGGR